MKKLALSLIVILILSGLSGCLDNKTDNKGNDTQSTENSEGIQTGAKSDIKENVGTEVEKIGINSKGTETMTASGESNGESSAESRGESAWCVPGDKITANNEEFTVVGITTYTKEDKKYDSVCKAEKVTKDGSSTIYYNEGYVNKGNDQFFEMISKGKNAKASAIVTVGK